MFLSFFDTIYLGVRKKCDVMEYKEKVVDDTKKRIDKKDFITVCRLSDKDFTRKRKVMPADIIKYELNKKGLTSKMEIRNYNKISDIKNISSSGMFQQREKLNPDAFKFLMQMNLKTFYHEYKNEVKTINGYVIKAVDGSDFEVPNTKTTRKLYNGKLQDQCARVTVSTEYDVLNHYTLDVVVKEYNYSEISMFLEHEKTISDNDLLGDFKSITTADRNYKNLSLFYNYIKNDNKFVFRISGSVYKNEISKMKSNDEIIKIGYEYNRVKYYKETDPELYEYLKSGNTIDIRCVKIPLDTGEIEYLLTNLSKDEFTYEQINELYQSRWGIEINYKHLKNNLKIECITSGKMLLIEQDIYSQILVANILQAFINDGDESIEQDKYKHKHKINKNMAIGIFKNEFINVLLEDDADKRSEMTSRIMDEIREYTLPEKPNRKNVRKNNPKNRYNINQRKSF